MRGNRLRLHFADPIRRSIPACAGEPLDAIHARQDVEVYPRVCGGTGFAFITFAIGQGLSPRVRGNHSIAGVGYAASRSIPACAGEPRWCESCSSRCWVYPRVCGGTSCRTPSIPSCHGLSPRVRGNHQAHRRHKGLVGSIPACAGEPRSILPSASLQSVYPRVCGGTL